MNRNDAVEIRPVGNGYMVRRPYNLARDKMESDDEVLVFQSFSALLTFLQDHFTFRCGSIPKDVD